MMPDTYYFPTIYVVTQHAPGCLPDGDPELVTFDEDEAIEAFAELAFELANAFYVADLDEINTDHPAYLDLFDGLVSDTDPF